MLLPSCDPRRWTERRAGPDCSNAIKPVWLDANAFNHLCFNPETVFLQQLAKPVTIDEINRNRAVARGFVRSLAGKVPSGDEQPFICTALQSPPEVTDFLGADAALPTLALKVDLERHKIDAQHSDTVDPAIAGLPPHLNFDEARFAQKALRKSLESVRRHLAQHGQKRRLPIFLIGRAVFGHVVGQNIRLYNLSRFTSASLKGQDAKDIHGNLVNYVTNFSGNVRDIFIDKFLFTDQLKRLNDAGLLYQVFDRFTQIELHPDAISNIEMGYLFEDLIRRFSEISNETAGEHYTPREVIRLIVSLLLINDNDALTGTGGMLSIAEMEMTALNDRIRVELFGQELNPETFAICKSDMLVTGHYKSRVRN